MRAVMVPDQDSGVGEVNKTFWDDGQKIKALYRSAPLTSQTCGFCWHLVLLLFFSICLKPKSKEWTIKTFDGVHTCVHMHVCMLKEKTKEDSRMWLSIFPCHIKNVSGCKRQLLSPTLKLFMELPPVSFYLSWENYHISFSKSGPSANPPIIACFILVGNTHPWHAHQKLVSTRPN